jgi:hypothetical protein
LSQAADLRWCAELGRNEPRSAARRGDGFDGVGAARSVASVHDHLGAIAGELQGDRATDAGRRAGHEGPLMLEATILSN